MHIGINLERGLRSSFLLERKKKIMSNLKKKFTVDEEIVWKFEDFDSQGEQNVKCRIVEVHEDYCVAHTEGNHNGYDDMRLCIEASNEENFHRI